MKNRWTYNSLEEIEKKISDPEIKIVSFDVFDTLLVRPVENCEDVFELLDKYYMKYSQAFISFAKLRIEAESVLRRRIINKQLTVEDICLTDIYNVLRDEFGLSYEVAESMLRHEIETETKLLRPRKSGKRLYEYAIGLGKKVVLCSDMYLEKSHLKEILSANGYEIEGEIFVSSEVGLRKTTGNLFGHMISELNVSANEIMHIGDNEESDCRIPAELGLSTAYLPSTNRMYYSCGCGHQVEKICHDLTDWEVAGRSIGIGAMRQMAANYYFDDPFRKFDKESDYNRDPYFVGYAALGMELLAVLKWMIEKMKDNKLDKLVFAARDGYLPMKGYELIKRYDNSLPKYEYAHISRRSLLPAMIVRKEDLYALPIDVTYQTPLKLMELLDFCHRVSEADYKGMTKIFDLGAEEKLTKDTFIRFIKGFIDNYYDEDKHKEAIDKISRYLTCGNEIHIDNSSAVFDMGYSGRIPAAIYYATGLKPHIFFFHADSRDSFRYEKKAGMKLDNFIDFKPYMESSIREYSYLEAAASCIGYDDDLNPLYDIGPAKGYEETCLKMQEGALQFISDYLEFFYEYKDEATFRLHDAAMPFEAFLRFCSEADKEMYERILIDDELWGGRRDINLKYLIDVRLKKIPEYAR